MQIEQIYSHLNGHEHILVHKRHLWLELTDAISLVDAQACRSIKVQEKHALGPNSYSSASMNQSFGAELLRRGWVMPPTVAWAGGDLQRVPSTLRTTSYAHALASAAPTVAPMYAPGQTVFVRERLAIEARFDKFTAGAYDLFAAHMTLFVDDLIDVGIEILPMKELQAEMSSGIAHYEGELYNVLRHGRGTPAVPLVLVGVAP